MNREGPDRMSVGDLEAYCREYPYCQVARMLLAVAAKKHGLDPEGAYAKSAMAYAVNRQVFLARLAEHDKDQAESETVIIESGTGFDIVSVLQVPYTETSRLSGQETDQPGEGHEAPQDAVMTEKQQKQQALIDRFLQSDARIVPEREVEREHPPVMPDGEEPGSEEPDSEEPGSEEPGSEEPEVLSETLAEILAGQGKTGKALGIYEKLCLKYPEKSSYFAKKIETLQNKTG